MDTLAFMASGPLPPNAADLLGSARLVSLLSIGTEIFDLIIVDGPPVLGLADSLILSSAASGTLLVVGAGVTRKGHIRGALRRLQLSRGHVIGAVLSSYDAKAVGYGADYAYGYDYHYRSQTQPSGLSIGGVIRSLARPQHSDVHENA
jgi:succinoglycan biosynthesis transport protein ExoP